ncbi:MAG TPA: TetR/AcrR family transcriptional regulator [Gemmatimonadota bacterium]
MLEAFRRRLRHYGYDKTTMAEIASDVGISVGTLYLEFDGKEDILAALTEETAREFERTFTDIASSGRGALDRLREVLAARVALSDRCCREGAHGGEVLVSGAPRCRKATEEKEERFLALVEGLIREGVAAGDVAASDPPAAARALRDGIALFLPPHSLDVPRDELLSRADRVLDLLLAGLTSTASPVSTGLQTV